MRQWLQFLKKWRTNRKWLFEFSRDFNNLLLIVAVVAICLFIYCTRFWPKGDDKLTYLFHDSWNSSRGSERTSNISLKSDGLAENDYLSLAVTSIICCLLLLLALSTDLSITLASGHRWETYLFFPWLVKQLQSRRNGHLLLWHSCL